MAIGNRKFGVEIECFGATREFIREKLCSAGIPCEIEGYNHTTRNYWKVTIDASINANLPMEVVSPPLSGEEGLEQVQKVARLLAEAGVTVNRSCGLHVHVDASGLTTRDFANIIVRYARFEYELDKFMPNSRRANNNGNYGHQNFCASVTSISNRVQSALSDSYYLDNIRSFISHVTSSDRYFKVNLLAYLSHGTVEFRHHSGSVNAEKISNWIRFCVNFVEQSIVRTPARLRTRTRRSRNSNGLKPKEQKIVDALREHSRRANELATISGYSPTSIPVVISGLRNKGYRIRKDRLYGTYRLISAPVNSSSSNNVEYDNSLPSDLADAWNRGLEPAVVSYYQERAADLAA